jgi:hypothetical protein
MDYKKHTREDIKTYLSAFYDRLKVHVPYSQHHHLMDRSFVAGGCITSMVLGEKINDIDVWFRDLESWEIVSSYFEAIKTSRFAKTSEICILNPFTKHYEKLEVQFIKNRIGNPLDTVAGFDFLHTHNFYTPDGELCCDEEFIKKKKLVFMKGNLEHPVNTFQRTLKFARRGYFMDSDSMIDMLTDLREAEAQYITKDQAGSR